MTVLRWLIVVPAAAVVGLTVAVTAAVWPRQPEVVHAPGRVAAASPIPSPSTSPPGPSPRPSAIPVPPAPAKLPVLDYFKRPPAGVPADAEPESPAPITRALRPARKLPVYDAPGGREVLRA